MQHGNNPKQSLRKTIIPGST